MLLILTIAVTTAAVCMMFDKPSLTEWLSLPKCLAWSWDTPAAVLLLLHSDEMCIFTHSALTCEWILRHWVTAACLWLWSGPYLWHNIPNVQNMCLINHLVVLPVKLTTVANRAFPVVGPRTWNDLPDDVTSAESLSTFRQRLKTHLFAKSFFWLFPELDSI